jgi:hypothetical protein
MFVLNMFAASNPNNTKKVTYSPPPSILPTSRI